MFLVFTTLISANAKKEKILFHLKFGFIKGGEAELVISDTLFGGKKAIHYHIYGKTTGLADKLFAVNDRYETTVNAQSHLPFKSVRDVSEGKYKWYNETLYYHDRDSIYSQKSGWRDAPENLVDIISVFFYFINNNKLDNLEPGRSVTLPTFHADKISDVTIIFMGEGKVETGMGEMDCYILAPSVDKGKLLKRSDGLKFYISKETKLPVLIDFDMRVGALKAIIESYKSEDDSQAAR
ncbi:MAG: DUF3108 domain-containing protein [Syntrophomonadaceae bacterium]|nr:DUF3108 domain-containing protein [Syntrophomonadaceae bacterium]